MRRPDFDLESVLGQRRFDSRREIAAIGIVVGMLELTAAAFRKVPAWRILVMRPVSQRTVVEHGITRDAEGNVAAAGGDSIATRGNPDDQLVHSEAMAAEIASARSSAINWRPAISAARP